METHGKKGTVEKYAHYIKTIYERTKSAPAPLSVKETHLWKVNNGILHQLIEMQLLKFVKREGRVNYYKWNSTEPNGKLAEVIRQKLVDKNYQYTKPQKTEVDYALVQKGDQVKGMSKKDFDKLVDKKVNEILQSRIKPKKVLRFRNPFYWKEVKL